GDSINAKTLSELNICGLTPEVEDKSTGEQFRYEIKPRRGGLGETVVYVNGIEARRYKPDQLKKSGEVYELELSKNELSSYFIAGKENPVTVKAFTADNTISSRGIIINEDKTQEKTTVAPNLYAVMVGVSDYKDEELDLKYAAKDANDISSAIAASARKLLNSDGKEHVFVYDLTTAEKRYQLPEKNGIKKVLEEIGRKATANDILLLFFAGHGVMSASAGQQQQFYFLTADASKSTAASALADVGISTAELTEWMKPQNIKAQKRILIFDACNSGQAIRDLVKVGNEGQGYIAARNDEQSQQIKAIDKLNEQSGFFILSASASNQSAYEMGRYSQGLLTYSLLKAIKQQPDILQDGKYLDVSRWFSAAEKTVTELTKENGARQQPQVISNTNFNIGIVDQEVMAKIVLPQEKPMFAASNFQNSDEKIADDDMELSKLINLQLSNLAARGAVSNIVYVTATNAPDAYNLTGRYTIRNNLVTVQVNLKQNKTIRKRFELSGTKDKLNELAAAIAAKAAELVKN
ncbi:MAG TPA: caspase family protein, partial [Chitinophagaceae bacterium]|nr:caspase family protein [Chitinophagaceae bacterium]